MPDAAARAQCGHGAQSDWDVLTIARLFGELQNGPVALLWAAEVRAFAAPPSPPGRLISLCNLHNPVAFKAWCISEND